MFHSLIHHSTLSSHGVNAFFLFPSRHAPNGSPLNLTSFGWSIIPARRTSQKGLGKSRRTGLFPSPHHQTIPPYLLPLTHGPTISHIDWLQAGGAWALCVLSFQICPKIYLLLMRLLRSGALFAQSVSPLRSFTWVILCFPAPLTSWALLDDGSYISLAHYLVSFISCNVVLLFLP